MKSIFTLLMVVASLATLTASADYGRGGGGRWRRPDDGRFRNGQTIGLGQVRIGNRDRRWDPDTIWVNQNPRIQCNLTHIQLSALNDDAFITAVEVEYRERDRNGNNRDMIDLNDNDDSWGGGRGRGGNRGIRLSPRMPSPWLDLDDVQDGYPSGRCVQAIRVFGMDIPDRGPGGPGRGGPGRGDDRCRRYGNCPQPAPTIIQVDGFLANRGPGGNPGGGGDHRPDRPHGPPVFLGSTGLVGKNRNELRRVPVGADKGRFDGIKLVAKDDLFAANTVDIYFTRGEPIKVTGLKIKEGNSIDIDFDQFNRRPGDGDRFINEIQISGGGGNVFGSDAQLEVWGIR